MNFHENAAGYSTLPILSIPHPAKRSTKTQPNQQHALNVMKRVKVFTKSFLNQHE